MRKETRKYYFSVEGETEKWYFDWLQDTINSISESKYNVKLIAEIQQDPVKYVKKMTIINKTDVVHIFDREGVKSSDTTKFLNTLDKMKKAEKLGKNIKYISAYSNLSFDLWIILHKKDCNASKYDCGQYLPIINKVYDEKFENLEKYKKEANFNKKILKKLNIQDVISAVKRAEKIMKTNKENGYELKKYKNYTFYEENPSLSIWEIIDRILKECEINL